MKVLRVVFISYLLLFLVSINYIGLDAESEINQENEAGEWSIQENEEILIRYRRGAGNATSKPKTSTTTAGKTKSTTKTTKITKTPSTTKTPNTTKTTTTTTTPTTTKPTTITTTTTPKPTTTEEKEEEIRDTNSGKKLFVTTQTCRVRKNHVCVPMCEEMYEGLVAPAEKDGKGVVTFLLIGILLICTGVFVFVALRIPLPEIYGKLMGWSKNAQYSSISSMHPKFGGDDPNQKPISPSAELISSNQLDDDVVDMTRIQKHRKFVLAKKLADAQDAQSSKFKKRGAIFIPLEVDMENLPTPPSVPENPVIPKFFYDEKGNEEFMIGSDVDDIELAPSTMKTTVTTEVTSTRSSTALAESKKAI